MKKTNVRISGSFLSNDNDIVGNFNKSLRIVLCGPSKVVFEPLNVILAEVVPGLDLDKYQFL